jgi:hypothetical protein
VCDVLRRTPPKDAIAINQIDETNQINKINQISLAISRVLCKNKNNLHFHDLEGTGFLGSYLKGRSGLEVRPEI